MTKAYKDEDFLMSHDAQPLRILAEYLQPRARFERCGVSRAVIFFGSARTQGHAQDGTGGAGYYAAARELAGRVASWTTETHPPSSRYFICTGGGPGIMEASNRGAWEVNPSLSMGLNISLPFEQRSNGYLNKDLDLEFHYFFMRKYWFAYLAKALVIFPGGFGTLDEMFEILTLSQTNKFAKKIGIVVYGSSYWKQVIDFDDLVQKGAISPKDRQLFQFADTPEEAFTLLRDGLIRNHLERDELWQEGEIEVPEIAHTRR